MVFDNPVMPTKSRISGRGAGGGGRKPRIAHAQRGQLPICGYVQRNPTESNPSPSFYNRSCGTRARIQQVLDSRQGSGQSAAAGGSGPWRGGSTQIQNRFSPYPANSRGSQKDFGHFGSSNPIKSPYFSAQARKAPPPGPTFEEQEESLQLRRKFGRPEVRPLLHLQGAYITQVKEWVKHKNTIELLMDVYGYVDSDVATKEFGRKEFLLRDETGSIYASYYEIDTPMLYVAKKTWLKLSCVWRTWGLQVVTIRFPEPDFMDNLETRAMNGKKILEEKLRLYDPPTF